MAYKYPFESLSSEEDKHDKSKPLVWIKDGFNLQTCVSGIDGPILEIGGPTLYGYYFLKDVSLNTKPIITNVSENPLPMFEDQSDETASMVDRKIDGRNIPFNDNSVGIVCMSCMSRAADDWFVELSEDDKQKSEVLEKINQEYELAGQEEELVAMGLLEPSKAKHALRIQIYCEINRVLCKGGLYFGNGKLSDILALSRMGFEILEVKQEYTKPNDELGEHQGQIGYSYEFVARKD